jgi:NodT family efflux transporter outer membrane factor (OMF) lipoprotein
VDLEEIERERVPALGEESAAEAPPPADLDTSWVADFGSTRLEELVGTTLADNPDAAAAAARLRAARAFVTIAGADRLPQLSAGASGQRSRTNTDVGGQVQSATTNRFGLDLNLSWEIDLWGRIADERRAALFAEAEAAALEEGTRLSLAASVSRAWFRALAAQRRLEVAARRVELAERNLRVTRARVDRGILGALDLSLARSDLASAETTLRQRQQARGEALRLVQTLTGAYPSGELDASAALPELADPPPPLVPSSVLARRPDLRAGAARIGETDRRVSAAAKALIPSLSLSGAAGTASDELSNLLNSDYSVWNLAGNLLQPLFQGGRLRARVEAERADLAIAIANYEGDLLTAFREVEDALEGDQYLREALDRVDEASASAEEASTLGFRQFQQGLLDLIQVLDLQDRAFAAELQRVDLQLAVLLNRIDLYAALGGGFPERAAAAPEQP